MFLSHTCSMYTHTHVNSFYHFHVACSTHDTRTMFGSTEMVSTSQQTDTVDFLAWGHLACTIREEEISIISISMKPSIKMVYVPVV